MLIRTCIDLWRYYPIISSYCSWWWRSSWAWSQALPLAAYSLFIWFFHANLRTDCRFRIDSWLNLWWYSVISFHLLLFICTYAVFMELFIAFHLRMLYFIQKELTILCLRYLCAQQYCLSVCSSKIVFLCFQIWRNLFPLKMLKQNDRLKSNELCKGHSRRIIISSFFSQYASVSFWKLFSQELVEW